MGNMILALKVLSALMVTVQEASLAGAALSKLLAKAREEGRDLTDEELDEVIRKREAVEKKARATLMEIKNG